MRQTSALLALSAALALLASHGAASADGLEERFEGSFPPEGWIVVDYTGDGVEWMLNDVWGDGNWTGGIGRCAEVSSTHSPGLDFDAALISPPFVVPEDGLLFFRANYQNFMGNDQFDVTVVMGFNNIELVAWRSDQGSFEALPGVEVVVPLLPMVIGQEVRLEFRYRDYHNVRSNAFYIQIDDVIVGDETAVERSGWGAIKALYR